MIDIDRHSLSECYGRAFSGCELVVPGVNRTYRLTARADAYYLRLYRPIGRSTAAIAFELRLLREARLTPGIDVARPILIAGRQDCAQVAFGSVARTACLFEAIDGQPMTQDQEGVTLFGSALAKLHGALAGIGGGERPLPLIQERCVRVPSWR